LGTLGALLRTPPLCCWRRRRNFAMSCRREAPHRGRRAGCGGAALMALTAAAWVDSILRARVRRQRHPGKRLWSLDPRRAGPGLAPRILAVHALQCATNGRQSPHLLPRDDRRSLAILDASSRTGTSMRDAARLLPEPGALAPRRSPCRMSAQRAHLPPSRPCLLHTTRSPVDMSRGGRCRPLPQFPMPRPITRPGFRLRAPSAWIEP
jgi:hypothetical protein